MTLNKYEEVLAWFEETLDDEEILIDEFAEVTVKEYLNGLINRKTLLPCN